MANLIIKASSCKIRKEREKKKIFRKEKLTR